jgi:heat shock transcription factor, other eukaryote
VEALVFEEMALAAGSEIGHAVPAATASQSAGGTATATDKVWYELLGEEQTEIDVEVEELLTATTAVEPWEEMGDEEVQELVQQIDCLGSPTSL